MSARKCYREAVRSGPDSSELEKWGLPNNQEYLRDERPPNEENEHKDRCFIAPGE